MRKIILLLLLYTSNVIAYAQSSLIIEIKDSNTQEPLPGASVMLKKLKIGGIADVNGQVSLNSITEGKHLVVTSFIGYSSRLDSIVFPLTDTLRLTLIQENDEMEEVVVTSTRSSRSISAIPTRIETISGEELEEKANMKPGDIRMVLNESTGIQSQITSATSGNASIRIQGLDGRFTQILKDGMPLYSGAAGGLGLLQIAPLDLKQVEVIKGSTSTLYGGGAIAGLVNLISKKPQKEKELSFLINGTNAGGLDLSTFYAKRNDKIGATIFAAYNQNKAYDPSDIGLSAIPKFDRFTLNPKIFLYPNEKTDLNFGINLSYEDRLGGDMSYIKNETLPSLYFEKNKTARLSTQFNLNHDLGDKKNINIKNSLSYFKRDLNIPNYKFDGTQYASFTEFSYHQEDEKLEWVAGANLWTDSFKEDNPQQAYDRTYHTNTVGAFLQNTWTIVDWLNLESGLRADYVFDYGWALLPRVSALFKVNEKLSSRIGGGFGYKPPTIFTEESERFLFNGVFPIDRNVNKLEKSYGANWDINYKTALANNKVSLSINHLFFYSYIKNPLMLENLNNANYQLVNINGNVNTKGTETNVKLGYDDFKLFLGYTFTNAKIEEGNSSKQNFLTSKHRINSVLFYEVDDEWKIGVEAYYFSKQNLSDGLIGKSYWMTGFMAEKIWERFSLFINFENFTDSRQTKFDTIYTGSVNQPVFRDIYAPLEGFVINGGIKIRL
jgi:outer membrane receptor for ferrienterochelin and colicins